jgi:hypothetical protein
MSSQPMQSDQASAPAASLPITGAVGFPVNPIAVK